MVQGPIVANTFSGRASHLSQKVNAKQHLKPTSGLISAMVLPLLFAPGKHRAPRLNDAEAVPSRVRHPLGTWAASLQQPVIPNAFKIHHLIDEYRAFHRELPCWSDMEHLMNLMSSAGQIVFEAWSWHHSYLGRIHDTLHWTTHLNEMRLTQVGSVSSRHLRPYHRGTWAVSALGPILTVRVQIP